MRPAGVTGATTIAARTLCRDLDRVEGLHGAMVPVTEARLILAGLERLVATMDEGTEAA